MTDEPTFEQRQELHRAERAQAILTDPLVVEALDTLRSATRDLVFDLPIEARERREQLYLMDRARQDFVRVFTAHLMSGEVVAKQLLMEQLEDQQTAAIRERVKER